MCLLIKGFVIGAVFFSGINGGTRPPDESAAHGHSSAEVANILINNLNKSLKINNITINILLNQTENKLDEGSDMIKSEIYNTFSQMDYLIKESSIVYSQCVEDIRQVGYSTFEKSNSALKICENEAIVNFKRIFLNAYSSIDKFKQEADESIRGGFDFCHIMESFNEKPLIFANCYDDRLRYVRLRASTIEFEYKTIQAHVLQNGLQNVHNFQICINAVLVTIKDILNDVSKAAKNC